MKEIVKNAIVNEISNNLGSYANYSFGEITDVFSWETEIFVKINDTWMTVSATWGDAITDDLNLYLLDVDAKLYDEDGELIEEFHYDKI